MKILVVGGGGREHALCWKLKQSSQLDTLYCAPGNAGIAQDAELVDIKADDIKGLLGFAQQNRIDLTVVGPELPLTKGIADVFEDEGLKVFGPSKAAAELEGSKVFSKDIMRKNNIPTAFYSSFTNMDDALRYGEEVGPPLVVKADGLAAGKGVIICKNKSELIRALNVVMEDRVFGDAGKRVVLENLLVGEEASFIAITDGETVLPLECSQDHKPLLDDDKGPNTGGMGAYSPAPIVTPEVHAKIMEKVMLPMVSAMKKEGKPYQGVLYAGIMIKDGEINVLEFNVRMGDPETQPLLMRLETDLVELMLACLEGRLKDMTLKWTPSPSVCIVMASNGYPGHYEKGHIISGIEEAENSGPNVKVFHAGTATDDAGNIVTNGGRVLGVTALGEDVKAAIENAYNATSKISWEGAFCRKDIGHKAINKK